MSREAEPGLLWNYYGVPEMWEMVKDEDGVPTHQQVGAWQKMAALCTDQADALQRALDQLMVRWPPNPGSASERFKSLLDLMIWSMRDSATAAAANVAPLIEIVMLLGQARGEMGELMKQYNAYQQAEDDGVVPTPPAGWRQTLDGQARAVMFLTDRQVGQAASQIKSPNLYPGMRRPNVDESGPPNNTNPPAVASVVPPPRFDPPSPTFRSSVVAPAGPFDNGLASDGLTELDGIRLAPAGPVMATDDSALRSPYVQTPNGVVLAPGGVIGGTVGPDGRSIVGGATGAPHVVGGHTGPAGPIPPPMVARPGVNTSTGRSLTSGGRRRRRSDPPDPWAPPPGVPSVLEPSREPDDFDPGPNVIGIDR
jgi:hypothetical protein